MCLAWGAGMDPGTHLMWGSDVGASRYLPVCAHLTRPLLLLLSTLDTTEGNWTPVRVCR